VKKGEANWKLLNDESLTLGLTFNFKAPIGDSRVESLQAPIPTNIESELVKPNPQVASLTKANFLIWSLEKKWKLWRLFQTLKHIC